MKHNFDYYLERSKEVGFVQSFTGSVVYADGLPNVCPQEIVIFENNQLGQVLFLQKDLVEILLLSSVEIKTGIRVTRTQEKLKLPIGQELLGHIINPLCQPLDSLSTFHPPSHTRPLNSQTPSISDRTKILKPLETGVAVVDMLVPLGLGQRELAIGDRKTGKTSFVVKTICSQKNTDLTIIYTAIAKRKSEVKKIHELLVKNKIHAKTIIVLATTEDGAGLIYLAPFTAIAIAEYFRDLGKNCLVIFDDLTTHAKYYREISLLARKFPGRDSYPVDIFYNHAKIMEKGGNFKVNSHGSVSITLLPLAEAISGDLTGYVQTNLMSMTDGHIFFDQDYFIAGKRPAINPFLSVTRVGHQTQIPIKREISHRLLSFLTLYQKMQGFTHFGAELNDEVKSILTKGEHINLLFQQKSDEVIPSNLSFSLFAVLDKDSKFPLKKIRIFLKKQIRRYQTNKKLRLKVDTLINSSKSYSQFQRSISEILKLK